MCYPDIRAILRTPAAAAAVVSLTHSLTHSLYLSLYILLRSFRVDLNCQLAVTAAADDDAVMLGELHTPHILTMNE